MLEFVITAFVTFFVVIDPVGILPIFMALTGKTTAAIRRQIPRSLDGQGETPAVFAAPRCSWRNDHFAER